MSWVADRFLRLVGRQDPTVRKGNWMETWSGVKFYPLDPRSEDIRIEDIAHSLARLNRYNGHADVAHYSVAEHSMHLAKALVRDTGDFRVAFEALMHDAPEAYVGDMVRPLKREPAMAKYVEAEDKVWRAIVEMEAHAGLLFYELTPIVKEYDTRILMDERAQVLRRSTNLWQDNDLEPLGVRIPGLPPSKAEYLFLELYHVLRQAAIDQ